MRLLRTDLNSGLCISEFDSEQTPSYAILSHTWEDGEVLFSDVRDQTYAHKAGHLKIQSACEQAQKDGYDYIWIDTCCIDKTSSAELSEAINSMWTYYQESRKCSAYLSDVTVVGELENREKPLILTLSQARWGAQRQRGSTGRVRRGWRRTRWGSCARIRCTRRSGSTYVVRWDWRRQVTLGGKRETWRRESS